MKEIKEIKEIKTKIITEALKQLDENCKDWPADYTREEVNTVQKLYEPESFDKLAILCEELGLSEDLIDMVTYTSTFSREEQEAYLINLQVFLEEPFHSQIENLKKALKLIYYLERYFLEEYTEENDIPEEKQAIYNSMLYAYEAFYTLKETLDDYKAFVCKLQTYKEFKAEFEDKGIDACVDSFEAR